MDQFDPRNLSSPAQQRDATALSAEIDGYEGAVIGWAASCPAVALIADTPPPDHHLPGSGGLL